MSVFVRELRYSDNLVVYCAWFRSVGHTGAFLKATTRPLCLSLSLSLSLSPGSNLLKCVGVG